MNRYHLREFDTPQLQQFALNDPSYVLSNWQVLGNIAEVPNNGIVSFLDYFVSVLIISGPTKNITKVVFPTQF